MSASAAPGDIRTPSVLLDNSFEVFIQRASGLGDSLEIDVDHEVLQQVVNDSGLAEVMVSFEADETGNAAHLTVLSEASACFTVSAIKKKSRRLKSKESSQKVIQEGIVIGLAKLASQDPEADDQTLKGKLGSFAAKRVQRTAKVIGGYAGGFLASGIVLQTVAEYSPDTIKVGSAIALSVAAGKEVKSRLRPIPKKEADLIYGYPPIINFRTTK